MDLQTISTIVGLCSPVVAFLVIVFTAGRRAEQYKILVEKVSEQSKQLEGLYKTIDTLQGVASKADGFKDGLGTLKAEISSLINTSADLKLKLSLLESAVHNQIKQWESLENSVTDLLSNNSGTAATVQHIKETTDRLTASIENARERISGIEGRCSTHGK